MFVEFEDYIAKYILQESLEISSGVIPSDISILTGWIQAGIEQYEKDTGYRFNIE